MKKHILLLLVVAILTMASCSTKTEYGQPNVEFKSLENDFGAWWNYHSYNIVLSSNFIGLDNSSTIISKEAFLEKLTSGNFIPLKLTSKDSATYYQLFELDQTADKDIRTIIKQSSFVDFKHFKMEGKAFPQFAFTDLNGVAYNNENTKGKTVIFKCWFIECKTCVAEFGELNELVEKYHNRNDIVFISLALDEKEKLNEFLSEKTFKYATVADQGKLITKGLGIGIYPTHLIVDQNGIIQKVVNSADELIMALKLQKATKAPMTQAPPPPPPPVI